MKKVYRNIRFNEPDRKYHQCKYVCVTNKGEILGLVDYCDEYGEYVLYPYDDQVISSINLYDISEFLRDLNKSLKELIMSNNKYLHDLNERLELYRVIKNSEYSYEIRGKIFNSFVGMFKYLTMPDAKPEFEFFKNHYFCTKEKGFKELSIIAEELNKQGVKE